MKIVQFKNGKYAIRKWSFILSYEYLDVDRAREGRSHYWWTPNNEFRQDFEINSIEEARQLLEWVKIRRKFDYGKPIKEEK